MTFSKYGITVCQTVCFTLKAVKEFDPLSKPEVASEFMGANRLLAAVNGIPICMLVLVSFTHRPHFKLSRTKKIASA